MCLDSVSMAIFLGAPLQMGTSPGDGAGWAAGLDTGGAAGGLVHGKSAIFLL